MSSSALNKELILDLANGQRLNFEAYGRNQKIPQEVLDIHNPSMKMFRDRQFNIFTKLNSMLSSTVNGSMLTSSLLKAMSFLIKPYSGPTIQERIRIAESIDCFSKSFEDQTIQLVREELKKIFKTKNITVIYSNETVNVFDLYFDDITDIEDVVPDPLDFHFTNGFFALKRPDLVQITVIVNPIKVRSLYVSNTDNNDSGSYNVTVSLLGYDFINSTLIALLSDQYREIRTCQILTSFNIVKEMGKRGISSSLMLGEYTNYKEVLGNTFTLYDNTLKDFGMSGSNNIIAYAYPSWTDVVQKLNYLSSDFASNPVYLYHMIAELSDFELVLNIKRKWTTFNYKGRGRLSTLMKVDPKASTETNAYRASIATKRLLPFIYYSTYFKSGGLTFPVTTRINTAITNSLTSANSVSNTNVNYNSLKLILVRLGVLSTEYFKVLNNPIYMNKNVVEIVRDLSTTDTLRLQQYKMEVAE